MQRTLNAFEDFSGVDYRARLLRSTAISGDPLAKFGELNDEGDLIRHLWVAENKKITFQRVAGAWWEEIMDPLNMYGMKRNITILPRRYLEVILPDWSGAANGRERIGGSVLLFDPHEPHQQLRLSQR